MAHSIAEISENTPLLISSSDANAANAEILEDQTIPRTYIWKDYLDEFRIIGFYTLPILG